jgi:hypothetical protein
MCSLPHARNMEIKMRWWWCSMVPRQRGGSNEHAEGRKLLGKYLMRQRPPDQELSFISLSAVPPTGQTSSPLELSTWHARQYTEAPAPCLLLSRPLALVCRPSHTPGRALQSVIRWASSPTEEKGPIYRDLIRSLIIHQDLAPRSRRKPHSSSSTEREIAEESSTKDTAKFCF